MQTKYFIIGFNNSLCYEYAQYFQQSLPNDLSMGRLTTTDPYYKISRMYKYFTPKEVKSIFENNEFVFLHNGQGLMKSTLENCNLFVLSVEDFLLVPNSIFNKYDIVLIWFDTNKQDRLNNYNNSDKHVDFDTIERFEQSVMHQFIECMKGRKIMYFKKETDIERLSLLLQYIRKDTPEARRKLLNCEY